MAICSKCGAQLFETSKFCPECGTPVLEVSTDTNKTGDIYSASENADDENSMAVFQGIDPSEISPDETAEILEAAAEKALEDIPEIVKIEGVDIHTEKPGEIASEVSEAAEIPETAKVSKASEAPKAETSKAEAPKAEKQEEKNEPEKEAPAKDDFSDMGAYVPGEGASEFKKTAEEAAPKKKSGGKTAAVIIAVVVIAAAAGAGVYFMGGHNSSQPAVGTTVTVTEAADEAVTEVSVDNESTPDSEISDTEVTTVTETETEETTESETTEAVTEAVSMKTAEEFAAGIEITPEHKAAAENEASCTISLAAEGLSADMLSDGGLLVVSYTAETAQTGTIPVTVYMTVTVGGTDIDVVASSSGDGVAVFEFANMASAVAENGFSAADIDCISFKGTGAGVDVTSITVMKG